MARATFREVRRHKGRQCPRVLLNLRSSVQGWCVGIRHRYRFSREANSRTRACLLCLLAVTTYQSPAHDARDLKLHGPRLEIKVGRPILRDANGRIVPNAVQGKPKFSTMPALIDTGAQRTVLTPAAVNKVGLSKINETELRGVGGIVPNVGVYVASIQFPRPRFATIEVIEVSCCELSHPLIECLLGRDVLSRWRFSYDGPAGTWNIQEENTSLWVEPPEGLDIWGK